MTWVIPFTTDLWIDHVRTVLKVGVDVSASDSELGPSPGVSTTFEDVPVEVPKARVVRFNIGADKRGTALTAIARNSSVRVPYGQCCIITPTPS